VDGSSVQLLDARIRADSVAGTDPTSRGRIAFATSRITRVESQEYSQSRTLTLFAAMGLAFLATTLYLVAHNK